MRTRCVLGGTNFGRLSSAYSVLSSATRHKSSLGKTTTQAAKEAEVRAEELERDIATLTAENNALLDKIAARQRFRERMTDLTIQALKGGDGSASSSMSVDEPMNAREKKGIVAMLRAEIAMGGGIPSTIKAGGGGVGAGDEANGIVDPMMPIRVHKTRNLTNPKAIDSMLESSAVIGSAHMNEIILVGKVVKGPPVFGHMDGRVDISNTDDYFKTAGLQHAAKKDVMPSTSSSSSAPSSKDTTSSTAGDVPFPVPILQFTLSQIGFRPLGIFPAALRPALNYFVIQVRDPYMSTKINEGDVVVLKGHYGLHALFQLDTSSWQTHPTVDVGPSGFIGVL